MSTSTPQAYAPGNLHEFKLAKTGTTWTVKPFGT